MKVKLIVAMICSSAALIFADGWSESGFLSPVKIETVSIKDDNSVLVKFVNVNKICYFSNKPQMLSLILTAKSTGASVRVWTTTAVSSYPTSDIPPGGIAWAHYLGAIQLVD